MIFYLVLAVAATLAFDDVPSHLRTRWLSEVIREKDELKRKRDDPPSNTTTTSSMLAANANLTVAPAFIAGTSAEVTISWNGVLNASANDFIGYFCTDEKDTDWLDTFKASLAKSTYLSGFGSLNMTLYTIRCQLQFRYFSASNVKKSILKSNEITFNGGIGGEIPHAVRVSYGPDETTQIWLSFTTNSKTPEPFAVVNGKAFSGTTTTYDEGDLCGTPANISRWDWYEDVGYFHHILLSGLTPGEEVVVTFGQGRGVATTTVRTVQYRGQESDSVTFVVVGNMGIYPAPASDLTAKVLTKWADEEKMDFVVHVGGLSLARGRTFMWDTFHAIIEPVARRIPWLVTAGSAEISCVEAKCYGRNGDPSGDSLFYHPSWGNLGRGDSNGEGGIPLSRRFMSPANELTHDNGVFWYSFDLPYATVLVLSLEHNIEKGSKQYYWLKWRASLIDRHSWLIVLGHRPMYNPIVHPQDKEVGDNLVRLLEPILLDAEVDIYISGHYASYVRTCTMRESRCVQDDVQTRGIYHVTAGNGGSELDKPIFYANTTLGEGAPVNGSWVNKWIGQYGFTAVTVANETNMWLESYTTGMHPNGTVFYTLADRFDMVRESRSDDDVSDSAGRLVWAVALGLMVLGLLVLAPIVMTISKKVQLHKVEKV